jgi:hypothetical protein
VNSWGLKRCVHTSFFPDRITGFLVGSPLQKEGEVFCFAGFSGVVGLKMSDQRDFWGDLKCKSELISRGESEEGNQKLKSIVFQGPRDLIMMELNQARNTRP